MEVLFLLVVFWLCYRLMSAVFSWGSRSNRPRNYRQRSTTDHEPLSRQRHTENPYVYKPKRTQPKSRRIQFADSISVNSGQVSSRKQEFDLDGLHDAFTGAPLDPDLGLYQCRKCTVFYHTESFQVLQEANQSRCVSCQTAQIQLVQTYQGHKSGADYDPKLATINNYKNFVGAVATFEGYVFQVLESSRGNDFAVMLEDQSWSKGFKLVFFRGAVQKVGGEKYISSLLHRTLRVRGLIVKHERYGYQIIISEKSMILGVTE